MYYRYINVLYIYLYITHKGIYFYLNKIIKYIHMFVCLLNNIVITRSKYLFIK